MGFTWCLHLFNQYYIIINRNTTNNRTLKISPLKFKLINIYCKKSLKRFKNLEVIYLSMDGDIDALAERSMTLQANISDNELTLINDEKSILIEQNFYKELLTRSAN